MIRQFIFLGVLTLGVAGCEKEQPTPQPPKPNPIQETATWKTLTGWEADQQQEAWQALLNNCWRMKDKPLWIDICSKAKNMPILKKEAQTFFEENFTLKTLKKSDGEREGLMTGYYEPLLYGSYKADERFKYPLYKTPDNMLIVDLGSLYPELQGKRVRAQLEGNRVVPYYDRQSIDGFSKPLSGQELLWVDNYIDLFFLQIQGSGRVQLPDGKVVGVGYANQNGHPYVSIGKVLIEKGWMERKGMSMFTLKQWLRENPDKAEEILFANPSYVFFQLREDVEAGPRGSLNVPLVAERSIAVDPKMIPLGSALWVDSHYPDGTPLRKLVFAQDTGGAIKGELRADFFFGTGQQAEQWAGTMKQKARFYLLEPKVSSSAP